MPGSRAHPPQLDQQPNIEFTKLAPVLNVRDLASERRFYESLGLPAIYEGPEYPDSIAFGTESVDFGIQQTLTDNDPSQHAHMADRRCRH